LAGFGVMAFLLENVTKTFAVVDKDAEPASYVRVVSLFSFLNDVVELFVVFG